MASPRAAAATTLGTARRAAASPAATCSSPASAVQPSLLHTATQSLGKLRQTMTATPFTRSPRSPRGLRLTTFTRVAAVLVFALAAWRTAWMLQVRSLELVRLALVPLHCCAISQQPAKK